MPSASPGRSVRGVTFDATGTLFELAESVGEVYARIALDYGVDLPAWRLDDAFARAIRHLPPRVFPDARDDEIANLERAWWFQLLRSTFLAADSTTRFSDADAFYERTYRHYETADAWTLREGASTLLADLHAQGRAIGLVSNFDQRITKILEALEIDGLFDFVSVPARCRALKPDPRIFLAALEALGLAPEETLHVGDHPDKDVAAARALGMHALDVRNLASLADVHEALQAIESDARADA